LFKIGLKGGISVLLTLILTTASLIELTSTLRFYRGVNFEVFGALVSSVSLSPNLPLSALIAATLDTLLIAVTGTWVGFLASVVLVVSLARWPRILRAIFLSPIWFLRGVPDVVMAVLLVQVFGIGSAVGVLGLALGTLGVSGKLILDTLEGRQLLLERAMVRGGQSSFGLHVLVILPSIAIELISQALLRFEINFRIAVVLGLVGGSGLGMLLRRSLGLMDYSSALLILLGIVIFVLGAESVARLSRKVLEGSSKSILRSVPLWVSLSSLSLVSLYQIAQLFLAGQFALRLDQALKLLAGLATPDFASQSSSLWDGFIRSLLSSALASTVAFLLALVIAILVSSRIRPESNLILTLRSAVSAFRAIPLAVLALFLVLLFGLGPFSSFLALAIGGAMFMSRIILDILDQTAAPLLASLLRSGAGLGTRSLTVLFQNKLRIQKALFFNLDFIFRYSVILGILGNGGLGTVILNAVRVQDFSTVSAATILIIAVVLALEVLQNFIVPKREESSR